MAPEQTNAKASTILTPILIIFTMAAGFMQLSGPSYWGNNLFAASILEHNQIPMKILPREGWLKDIL